LPRQVHRDDPTVAVSNNEDVLDVVLSADDLVPDGDGVVLRVLAPGDTLGLSFVINVSILICVEDDNSIASLDGS